jgi:uncharacterized protein YggE
MTTSQPADGSSLSYGTPDRPRVAVRGEVRWEVEPEIARIGVTVMVRGRDRRGALDDLTRRNGAALDLVKSYGEAVEKLETSALTVSPELTKHGRGERLRTYSGRVHLTATVSDFTALGELTTRLADLELTSVDGPWWALRPDSAVYRRARQRAVREAVTRAREYAEALGAELFALVELADEGAEGDQPYAFRAPGAMTFAQSEMAEDVRALDLEPQRQVVTARVNARFIMTRPEL